MVCLFAYSHWPALRVRYREQKDREPEHLLNVLKGWRADNSILSDDVILEIGYENLKEVCLFSLGGVRGRWDKEGSPENIAFERGLGGSVEYLSEAGRKGLLFS